VQISLSKKVQDDSPAIERRIGSWSREQGVKNQWNPFPKTEKSVANRQTMPRVAAEKTNERNIWEEAAGKGLSSETTRRDFWQV
jgi:hypothetical protein